MRVQSSILLLVVLVPLPLRGQERSAGHGIASVAWLAGCWEFRHSNRTTIEMWMPPAGGLMLGSSRTVADGAVREWEQLMLRESAGRLIYTARPSGQTEASFTSTEVNESSFTVVNPDHDFPQRIRYSRVGADSLVARVEGPGPSGTRGFELAMHRIECHR